MADKERTLTDSVREVANNPTVQRVAEAGREFVADPLGIRGATRAVQARKKAKAKQGRSSSGRQ
jgi:hypothetical protein